MNVEGKRNVRTGFYRLTQIHAGRGCVGKRLSNDRLYMAKFWSSLCPSTSGSNPLPESANFLCLLLSLSVWFPVSPHSHLSKDILVFQLILRLLSTVCASNGSSIVFHLGDVSSSFPLCVGYVFSDVRHSGSLPNDGVTDSIV